MLVWEDLWVPQQSEGYGVSPGRTVDPMKEVGYGVS